MFVKLLAYFLWTRCTNRDKIVQEMCLRWAVHIAEYVH